MPGFATCPSSRLARNFFALFSPEEYRTAAACYLQTPDHWNEAKHPYFSEPEPSSELYNLSRDLYGVESLFRTSLVRHPCKVDRLRVFAATSEALKTPVIVGASKFELDDVISTVLRPFYQLGLGQALCAVCLCVVRKNSDLAQPAFFGRSDYMQHYREFHWDHSIVAGLHVPTQLNTRYYQAHLLYVLCLSSNPTVEDDRGGALVDLETFPGLDYCDIMQEMVLDPRWGPVSARLGGAVLSDPPGAAALQAQVPQAAPAAQEGSASGSSGDELMMASMTGMHSYDTTGSERTDGEY
jgi:hypothetical protein